MTKKIKYVEEKSQYMAKTPLGGQRGLKIFLFKN